MEAILAAKFTEILKSAGGVLAAVAILLVMVTIHEFGHYLAGKALGFKINEFSVGFGPAIYKKRSKKTGELFALRVIPLGGYCAFDGEDDTEEESANGAAPQAEKTEKQPDEEAPFGELETPAVSAAVPQAQAGAKERAEEESYPEPKGERFNDQPPWKRIIVLLAGAAMNYLLGVLLIFVMFLSCGRPLYRVASLPEGENAAQIQTPLRADDVIMSIEGRRLYLISDYMAAMKGKNKGDTVTAEVLRLENGALKQITLQITLGASHDEFDSLGKATGVLKALGVTGLASVTVKEKFGVTVGDSFAYSWKEAGMVLSSLGQLVTGKISIRSMGGPITTIKVASEQARGGWMSFLNIASFIGVNLAVFNLLPIPALDGSKVVFCIIEWIRKKPINRKVEAAIHFIGIVFLFAFAILVDILQLF